MLAKDNLANVMISINQCMSLHIFREGGSVNSPLKVRLCDYHEAIPPIRSYGNRLYLKFKSDGSRTRSGFQLEYGSSASGMFHLKISQYIVIMNF